MNIIYKKRIVGGKFFCYLNLEYFSTINVMHFLFENIINAKYNNKQKKMASNIVLIKF